MCWKGKRLNIPKRLWSDVKGMVIEVMKSPPPKALGKAFYSWEENDGWLRRPRVYLSTTEGTALIEWRKPGEGGGYEVYRWMVSKAGSVIRHCQEVGENL